jgi:hypothetical protein
MKKRIFTVLIILFVLSGFLFAQESKVDKINKYCKSINENIKDDGEYYSGYWVHTINFSSNRRAIGLQLTTVKFYYEQPRDSLVENEQQSDIVDVYKPPVKIKIEYNIAASQNIKIEYYYDEKGELVYYNYLTKGAYTNGEGNFYFENNKPVKIKYAPLDEGKEVLEKYRKLEKDSDYNKDDLNNVKKILSKANDYKKMFDQLIYIEKLDK